MIIQHIFVDIIKLSLWDDPLDEEHLSALSDEDWKTLFGVAQQQALPAIFIDGLDKLGSIPPNCRNLLEEVAAVTVIGSEQRWQKQFHIAKRLAATYQQHEIRTLLLKGLGLSLCYPNPQHRECNDIDIYLFGKYEEGNQLAEQLLGAQVDKFTKKEDHIFLDGFTFDNHIHFKHPETDNDREFDLYLKGLLQSNELSVFPDSCLLLPPPEFNYLFLMSHAYVHFLREGMALRQMTDIACFLKVYEKDLEWAVINDKLHRFHLKKFSDTILSFIRHYFGLSFGYSINADTQLLERMLNDILTHSHAVAYHNSKLEARVYMAKLLWNSHWRYDAFYKGGTMRFVLDKLIRKITKLVS